MKGVKIENGHALHVEAEVSNISFGEQDAIVEFETQLVDETTNEAESIPSPGHVILSIERAEKLHILAVQLVDEQLANEKASAAQVAAAVPAMEVAQTAPDASSPEPNEPATESTTSANDAVLPVEHTETAPDAEGTHNPS